MLDETKLGVLFEQRTISVGDSPSWPWFRDVICDLELASMLSWVCKAPNDRLLLCFGDAHGGYVVYDERGSESEQL